MKNKIVHGSVVGGLGALCLALLVGVAEAKPDKGKEKGGKPGHSEKGKSGKPDKGRAQANNKGNSKKADKGFGKTQKDFAKDVGKSDKNLSKDVEKSYKEADKEIAKWREKRFRDEERNSVLEYFGQYKDNEYGLPPGLAKNVARGKALPPGWQKKLVSGYVIEDDYFDDFSPLAYDLFPGLDPVPDTRLYRYGDRVVRVYEPRREIIDVIPVPSIRFD